jgi:hypothetical protein
MKNLISSLLAASVAVISSMPFAAIAQSNPRQPELCETYKVFAGVPSTPAIVTMNCELKGTVILDGDTTYLWTLGGFVAFASNYDGSYVSSVVFPNSTSLKELNQACPMLTPFTGFVQGEPLVTEKGTRGCSFYNY